MRDSNTNGDDGFTKYSIIAHLLPNSISGLCQITLKRKTHYVYVYLVVFFANILAELRHGNLESTGSMSFLKQL